MLNPKQRSQLEQLLARCMTKHQIRTQWGDAIYQFIMRHPDKISPVGFVDKIPLYDIDEVLDNWEAQARPHKRWTSKELALLVSARADGMGYARIGQILGRSSDSCRVKHQETTKPLGEETNEQAA